MAGSRIKLGTPAILVRNFTTELPRPIFMIHIAPTTKHTYMYYHIIYEFRFQYMKYGLRLSFRTMYMCNNLYLYNIKYLGLLSGKICRILFMISRSESSGKVTLHKAKIDRVTALRFSGTNILHLIGVGGKNTSITKIIKL